MGRKNRIFIFLVAGLFILLVILEGTRKKPVNWQYSFSSKDKIPYGSYLLKDILKSVHPGSKFIDNYDELFLYTRYNPSPEKSAFIFITKYFSLDKFDLDELLSFAKKGNDIFISAEGFSKNIYDTLNFNYIYKWEHPLDSNRFTQLNFTNPGLISNSGYRVNSDFAKFRITSFDTSKTIILGTDKNNEADFIKIQNGKGNIFISLTPFLFTNYNILYGNYKYTFAALSYLREDTIIWDEFYKPNKPVIRSPLRYILSQSALKAAYYLLLITILIYLFFKGKRKQRIIPIMQPPQNMSLEFARTLGQLYFNNGNNKDIALKKFSFFCDYVRNKFYIKNITEDSEFYMQLAERSGVDIETVTNIFKYSNVIKAQARTFDEDLVYFNSMIEEFYNKTK